MKLSTLLSVGGVLFSSVLTGCKSSSTTIVPAVESGPSTMVSPTTKPIEVVILKFAAASAARITAGTQTSTTRKGIRHYPIGQAIMASGDTSRPIEITGIKYNKFSELTLDQAKSDGFGTLQELKESLRANWPDIVDFDDMTTVYLVAPEK